MDEILTEEVVVTLSSIEKKLTRLEQEIRMDLKLRKANKIKNIYSSLAIENNTLTVDQVTAIINGERVLGEEKEIQEVINAFEIYNQFESLNPYCENDLLYAHRVLTNKVVINNGKYRTTDVGIYNDEGQLVHMGARPNYIGEQMSKLFEYINKSNLSPVLKACIFHYELEYVHPFEDGNGRMGRLWQNLILSKYSNVFEFLTIETLIYQNQATYYRKLQLSDVAGSSQIFVEYMLELLNQTLGEYCHSRVIELSNNEYTAYNKLAIYLEQNKRITTSQFATEIGKAPATARRYMAKYLELGLIESHGKNKARFYTI